MRSPIRDDEIDEEEPCFDEDFDLPDGTRFADPGGRSALRAATADDPRDQACPTCKMPNRLTLADVGHSYQCDACADADEGGF